MGENAPTPILKGRRLALDFGLSRIGVAVSDPDGQFAFPTTVIDTDAWEDDLARIIEEYQPVVIYVGYPVNLSGDAGSSARLAREFAIEVASQHSRLIRLVDERLTTKSALSQMRAAGKSEREGRGEIDAVAATLLLEGVLLTERNTGSYAGDEI
jgi:putative Holliday junction resolvase